MTERTLWRLDGASDTTLAQPLRLEQGLRLHLQHTELITVLMQIGALQQSYISLGGCEGCAHGRCMPGCYVELLRRLLRVCFDACTLRSVAGGLAKRPYQRVALAWPTAKAAPLADMSLSSWPEVRLSIHWRAAQRQIACAALLAVGADGPDPAQALRSFGWKTWTLPKSLGPKLANSTLPSALPFPGVWSQAPTLLWPRLAMLPATDSVLAEADALNQLCRTHERENIHALH
jgi:hypothetical protein